MYVIIDCETTGLPKNPRAPISDIDNWPRVVQVAWSRYDKKENHVESVSHLVRPDGFTIPKDVQRIHGITTARARAKGKELLIVLNEFAAAVKKSKIVVAHNIRFDKCIISAEYLRKGLKPPFDGKQCICTMMDSTKFCRLKNPHGLKWPKLSELHWELFKSKFAETHDASKDVATCAKCFFELKKRNIISL